MHFKRMVYRKIRNLGNYETAHLEIEVALDTESPDEVEAKFEELKHFVHQRLHRPNPQQWQEGDGIEF